MSLPVAATMLFHVGFGFIGALWSSQKGLAWTEQNALFHVGLGFCVWFVVDQLFIERSSEGQKVEIVSQSRLKFSTEIAHFKRDCFFSRFGPLGANSAKTECQSETDSPKSAKRGGKSAKTVRKRQRKQARKSAQPSAGAFCCSVFTESVILTFMCQWPYSSGHLGFSCLACTSLHASLSLSLSPTKVGHNRPAGPSDGSWPCSEPQWSRSGRRLRGSCESWLAASALDS